MIHYVVIDKKILIWVPYKIGLLLPKTFAKQTSPVYLVLTTLLLKRKYEIIYYAKVNLCWTFIGFLLFILWLNKKDIIT